MLHVASNMNIEEEQWYSSSTETFYEAGNSESLPDKPLPESPSMITLESAQGYDDDQSPLLVYIETVQGSDCESFETPQLMHAHDEDDMTLVDLRRSSEGSVVRMRRESQPKISRRRASEPAVLHGETSQPPILRRGSIPERLTVIQEQEAAVPEMIAEVYDEQCPEPETPSRGRTLERTQRPRREPPTPKQRALSISKESLDDMKYRSLPASFGSMHITQEQKYFSLPHRPKPGTPLIQSSRQFKPAPSPAARAGFMHAFRRKPSGAWQQTQGSLFDVDSIVPESALAYNHRLMVLPWVTVVPDKTKEAMTRRSRRGSVLFVPPEPVILDRQLSPLSEQSAPSLAESDQEQVAYYNK